MSPTRCDSVLDDLQCLLQQGLALNQKYIKMTKLYNFEKKKKDEKEMWRKSTFPRNLTLSSLDGFRKTDGRTDGRRRTPAPAQ